MLLAIEPAPSHKTSARAESVSTANGECGLAILRWTVAMTVTRTTKRDAVPSWSVSAAIWRIRSLDEEDVKREFLGQSDMGQ